MSNTTHVCGDWCDDGAIAEVGLPAPDFEAKALHQNKEISVKLSDYRGKWAIIFFYPKDFTFICPTELEEMAEYYPKFQKLNTEVLSVSVDTVEVHKAWHDTSKAIKKVKFPMLSDATHEISELYATYIPEEGVSLRGTFIVDPDGIVKSMEMNDNSIGRSAKELYRKLQAAQFVAAHGGKVCPASWEPGDETIEPGLDLVGKI
ncbi:MAG: peroxiredoxin [Patescibacteria group bacterium]|nr:peroxiredoxin [Patescibacteria group bacterium]MDE1945652.1 peroxiredoxin [Patescibacteria group bacterium]